MFGRILHALRTLRRPPCRETWYPGDLGICISDSWMPAHPFDPKVDDLVRVRFVEKNRRGVVFLTFHGKPYPWRWEATAFRKIVPNYDVAIDEFANEIRKAAKAPGPKEHA